MPCRERYRLLLNDHHVWKARSRYYVFVADRCGVQFEFPKNWIVPRRVDSVMFHDTSPPAGECT